VGGAGGGVSGVVAGGAAALGPPAVGVEAGSLEQPLANAAKTSAAHHDLRIEIIGCLLSEIGVDPTGRAGTPPAADQPGPAHGMNPRILMGPCSSGQALTCPLPDQE